MSDLAFTEEEIERYSRHILLPEVGGTGQLKLKGASVFMVGAGGLGSPAIYYLAAAGVGRIGVADGDVVELSNLQRQIIHTTADLGRNKALSAKESIEAVNPACKVEILEERLGVSNIREAFAGYDLVMDGSDNFSTRFLISDCCYFEKIPLVSSAVLKFDGQLQTIMPGEENPCYRCLFPEPPPPGLIPSCHEAGVLGAVVGVMGTLQAVEAIKVLLGVGEIMSRRLLIYDALACEFRSVKRVRDPACPLCGEKATIEELAEVHYSCEAPCPTSCHRDQSSCS